MLVGLFNNDLFAPYQGTLQFRLGHPQSVRSTIRDQDLKARSALPVTISPGDIEVLEVKW
jgi:hypothetical protein